MIEGRTIICILIIFVTLARPQITPDCKTVSGPVPGVPCVFPFTYKGDVFKTCTDFDHAGKWCAIETDKDGNALAGKWGNCDCHSCDCSTEECKTVSGPVEGVPCVIPFAYKGEVHYTCTDVEHTGKWCSTGIDKERNALASKWGNCECVIKRVFAEPFDIKRNFQLVIMDFIGKEYKISFEFFVTKFGTDAFHNMLHFTQGGNLGQYGDRTPAVWIKKPATLHIASAVSGNPNANWNFEGIPEQKWVKVEISQTLVDGKYMFEASVEGLPKISVENSKASRFAPVKVLAGDNWHKPQDGQIRNLVIETKDEK